MEPKWLAAIAGGVLIGCAATLVWTALGKIAGVGGILAGVTRREHDADWRLAFLSGLALAGALVPPLLPRSLAAVPASWPPLAVVVTAGVLVGVGTRVANGCTSGHGICGIARFSARSWAATAVFVVVAALVGGVARLLGGAP